ncbi:DUF2169 family type VI secretion system accessory protein [Hyalangium versicolor]|uniref:DUF2169 family type VI secretion system accessory protein n=1 Tax=Hyalangium versicolor TaxID=2861190 RepID=UPI001CCD3158|nr:DUF2169 domain-containing protein [Hyalangium versicolor]
MGHPSTENLTPFTFEPLFLADEELRPLLVPVLKATFELSPQGKLTLAEEQAPLELAGQKWDDSDESSDRYEPEGAFFKPSTDVVLVGHAHAQERGTRELLVALKLGSLQKGVKVIGDRMWFKSLGSIAMTKPVPFERIPLRYERAFGGRDRSASDEAKPSFESRNPVGTGFRVNGSRFEEGIRLPNLEDPTQLIQEWGDTPPPAGFGFLGPHWQPRASFAGTYDAAWEKSRKPLLPRDFDRRFLNAASPGLIAPGYLQGNESGVIVNATPEGRLAFNLPGLPPPRVQVWRKNESDEELELRLDTVIIDTDAMRLFLLWRGLLVLAREPTEVEALEVTCEGSERWGPPQASVSQAG